MRTAAKYAIIFIGFAIILTGTSVCLALIYRNEILKRILTSTAQNNHINFEAKEVHFVLSLNLKNTSFLFETVNVTSKNYVMSKEAFSAQAESLGVEVDLLAFLLRKEIQIEKISVSNGRLFLFSPTSKATQGNTVNIEEVLRSVGQLSVENFTIYKQNDSISSKIFLNKVSLQHTPLLKGVQVKAKGNLRFTQIKSKFVQPTSNINFDVNSALAQGLLNISNAKIAVDGIHLTASGDLELQPLGQCNLSLTAKSASLEKVLPAVRQYAAIAEPESASGLLDAEVNVNGSLLSGGNLKLSAQGDVKHGVVKLKNLNSIDIHSLSYSLRGADLGNIKSYRCSIEDASVSYQGFELNGNASVNNFDTPMYEAALSFNGDVKTLSIEALPKGRIAGSARVKMREWSLSGIEKFDALVELAQLNAMLQKEKYVVEGEMFISKESAAVTANVQSNVVNGSFEGKIQGFLPCLLDSKKPCEMNVTGSCFANSLDLDRLLSPEDDDESLLTIRADVTAQAKDVLLFGEHYKNASAQVLYENSSVAIHKLTAGAYGGLLKGDLTIYAPRHDKKLNLDLYFNDVEIDKMSFLNENFNIKSGSIQGSCNGTLLLSSPFDEKGLNFEKAEGAVNITIRNGRLYEFEPIQPLSAHIKKKLLQDMQFAALRNTITITNGALIIPRMEIRSSALNTYVSGKQWFNGDFDYHLTLFVNELLLQKNRSVENPINDNKTKLFLRFTSKNGKREARIDSQEWGNNFVKKIQREAEEIQANSKGASAESGSEMKLEWEEQPLEKKATETPKKGEKKKPTGSQKPEVGIEWEP